MAKMKIPRDFATPQAWRNRGADIFKLIFPGLKPGAIQECYFMDRHYLIHKSWHELLQALININ